MQSQELETLTMVVHAGGFNNAAKRLVMTQSAVSQTIARMEKKIGTSLLVRSTPPKLTPAGVRVLEFADRYFQDVHTLERDLADISRQSHGRLNMGASQMVTNTKLGDILREFSELHPRISLDVVNLPSRELVLKVLNGDCEIGFGPFQQQMHAFECRPYYEHEMKLYASLQHADFDPLSRGDEEALGRATLITSYLDPVENRPGAQRLRYRFASVWQIASLNLRIRMIADGLGIGYLPAALVKSGERTRDLKALTRFTHGSVDRQVGLYHVERRPLSAVARLFVEFCDQHFEVKKSASKRVAQKKVRGKKVPGKEAGKSKSTSVRRS